MERALNLCDVGYRLVKYDRIKHIVPTYNRIYIGSYFCDRYFLKTSQNIFKEVAAIINMSEIKITLVIPCSSESNLRLMKLHVGKLLHKYKKSIDFVVVNDLGSLQWVRSNYDISIILGRLFSKALRDPRYTETLEQYIIPESCERIIDDYRCSGIEVEGCFQEIKKTTVDADYKIYLHSAPFYMSCMRQCFFSSIFKETNKKFRQNASCNLECSEYRLKNAISPNTMIHRIGKGVYFAVKDPITVNGNIECMIKMPIEMW